MLTVAPAFSRLTPRPPVPTRPRAPASELCAGLFGALARARGERAIHPDGDGYEGRFTPAPSPGPLAARAELVHAGAWPARVRFSRGFGLPEPWPELSSVAVKLPGLYGPAADQDLLMSAVWGARPRLRVLFRPGRSHVGRMYSSVLPFSLGGQTVLFGARVEGPRAAGAGDLEELARAAAAGGLRVALFVASLGGSWEPLGEVAVSRRYGPDEDGLLAFSPVNVGGGIGAAGRWQAVRGAGYVGSQAGRAA